jgi:phosphotransferase system enzyme I (PtsI)
MESISGKTIFGGIAIGKIHFCGKNETKVMRMYVDDTEREIWRLDTALREAKRQLEKLYDTAVSQIGEKEAAIFDAQSMILDDITYTESVRNMIKAQGCNAEYAVRLTGENMASMFALMDDEYIKERAFDIKDVTNRVVKILTGSEETISLREPCIIAAEVLTPGETLQMDKDMLLALITKEGSETSHTAILARTMNIPALTGIDVKKEWNGKNVIVDGYKGCVIFEPDEETVNEYRLLKAKEDEERALLDGLKGAETVTKSGKKVELYANIGSIDDIAAVISNDAEGIGLFRSEFIYLKDHDFPTEEEQYEVYSKVVRAMNGKKVIIRTFDIGADKQAEYFALGKEENPAMGYRAIRICLSHPEIFKTQLRAIYRAAALGNVGIMYPMITSLDEVRLIKTITGDVEAELLKEKIPYGNVEQGIMIETPAAALISDLLAKEVDFFSIGTNDLTQYTLAVDRQNSRLEGFYNPHHEAVLRLIKLVAENAHKAGISVGICGELGADPGLTKNFIDMGIDELSVSPACILPIRKLIRNIE